jgi:hypothetical protein
MAEIKPSITDLCGRAPITLLEALANCIYVNEIGQRYLNIICIDSACPDTQATTCAEVGQEFEQILVNSMFGLDDCGKFGVKLGGECLAALLDEIAENNK